MVISSIRLALQLALCLALVGSTQAAGRQFLSRHVPDAAKRLPPNGRLNEAKELNLSIGLPLRNKETLTNLLEQLYDPTHPLFHKYLTPEEFTERFGPAKEDYEAVKEFARTNGLTIQGEHSSRTLLDLSGSVTAIEKAFHLNLRTYHHPREDRSFFAPDVEPSLDITVPILDISGLDDFIVPHPNLKRQNLAAPLAIGKPLAGSGPSGTYMGNDFRNAYVPGTFLTGVGQTVALLQFDGYYSNDIVLYRNQSGVPSVPLQNVLLNGFSGSAGANNVEVALDIEMVNSMAPGISKIIVYEGLSGNTILQQMATDNTAKQISASWTFSANATTVQIYQQFGAQGQSYFNASGDSGAYASAPSPPTDDPYITVVGGTTLTTDGSGTWSSEKVWSWDNSGQRTNTSSGGGYSTSFTLPTWQQGISMTANQGSTSFRNLPDVSMIGDNVLVAADNGTLQSVGGTSVASPLWAGFAALLNQQAVANKLPTMGFLNPAIYALAKGTNYAAIFHDITVGNNTNSTNPTRFNAVTGYDLCTGWGTPTGTNFINALAPPANAPAIGYPVFALVSESCAPNGFVDPGETVTMNVTLQNFGGANTGNLVATLQSSGWIVPLNSPQTYGLLPAQGNAVTMPFTFTATGHPGDTNMFVLQVQDGTNNLGTFTNIFRLGFPAVTFTENFDGVTAPALPLGWVASTVGTGTAWATSGSSSDTSPNHAVALNPATVLDNRLTSPPMFVNTATAQLSFRHNYRTQSGFDGGVLEISTNGGAFVDIITAGGVFVANGYNRTLSTARSNPIGGRNAWSGTASSYLTTTVTLPTAAAGKIVQLRWRMGTDNATSSTGWSVDTISLADYAGCTPNNLAVAISSPSGYATNSTTLNIAGSSTDDVPVLQVTWKNNLGGSGIATGTTNWTASGITLFNGTNVITITANDAALHTNTAIMTVFVDAIAPVIFISSPAVQPSIATANNTLNLSGTTADSSGITQVAWTNSLGGGGLATGTTNWSIMGLPLQVGTNVITLTARDGLNNISYTNLIVVYALPVLTVNDTSVLEGDTGPTNAFFIVNLTPASAQTVTVHYATADGTAMAGEDYVALADSLLTFAPGQTNQSVSVTINGDSDIEPNETFFLKLTSQDGATLARAQATATILNDDAAAPQLSITVTNNLIVITWPASATNYFLQQLSPMDTLSTNWQPVTNIPVTINTQNIVTNTISATSALYRLKKP